MSEWKEYKLGEIVTLNYGKALKEQDRIKGNIPVFSSAGITGYHNEPLIKSIGIIIGRKGTVGKVYKSEKPFCCIDTAYYILPNNEIYNFTFLYYLLKTVGLEELNEDSAVPGLNRDTAYSQDILLPPLPEQRVIASVLSSLDDKIDLLHRQNATLEKMAETLFRQWFVEEAKEEWKIGTISAFAIHDKKSVQPQQNQTVNYYHYSIPAFDNNKNPAKELGEVIQSNKYIVPQYCILFSKLNPHKDKRVWLLQDEVKENSICSTEFQIVLPKKKEYLYFLYGWLSLRENYNEIASGVGGTSGSHQRIDPASIFDFQCPFVNEEIIGQYNCQVESMFMKIKTNQSQIRTLTQLRNTLLPKLMSREVRVGIDLKTIK